ncbi:hypothetical protein LINPERHAP2_LOCUS32793 [Linum perenne]
MVLVGLSYLTSRRGWLTQLKTSYLSLSTESVPAMFQLIGS